MRANSRSRGALWGALLGSLLLASLGVTGCAARFGEFHSAPALVVFESGGSTPLTFWLITPEENARLPRTAPLAPGALPDFEKLLASKTLYETSPNRHRMVPQRVVAVFQCTDGYHRTPIDMRGQTHVMLDCGGAG